MADINGTAGADLLFGAAAPDLVSGGGGNDIVYGGAGDDELLGGEGDDVLQGEAGDDRLDGGAGNDSLSSTDQGDDTLIGGEGDDTLWVDRNHAGDSLVLDGGAGKDRLVIDLVAVAAAVTAAGGGDDDTVDIFALRSSLALSLGAGRDVVNLLDFRTTVQGGGRVVIADFEAGAMGDRIGLGNLTTFDFTNWTPNSNPFSAGYLKAAQSGSDVVISASFTANGTFTDAIVLRNLLLSSLTPENLGGWTWDGSPIASLAMSGTGAAETLRGNGGDDVIHGLDGDDILEGLAGTDILWGGEGNDILRGGQGADQLHGGAGNDTLSSESAGEGLYGEDGDDRLTLSVAPNTTIGSVYGSGGAGNDTITVFGTSTNANFGIDAGSGDDLVSITTLANSASVTLGTGRDRLDIDNWFKSATNVATIEVTDFATGDGGDRLEWTSFLLRTMTGVYLPELFASGHARLFQDGADALLQIDRNGGGDQYSTLITFRNAAAAAFTAYNLGGIAPDGAAVAGMSVTGTADPDRLYGTDGDDVIQGLDGRDHLLGFHGDDEISGGAGDDTLSGGDGDDAIEGGDGNDVITPGTGDDVADGGEGNDQFIDNSGTSFGNKGFIGGGGDDSAYFYRSSDSADVFVGSGGDGRDYFSLETSGFSGRFIVDAGAGNDVLDVAGFGELTLGTGQDLLRIVNRPFLGEPGFIVHDFAAGDSGDRLGFWSLYRHFPGFDPSANPFATGHLLLSGSGADTYLYADFDGPGGSNPVFLATLLGVTRFSLTSHNIGGYALPFTVGTAASETFVGSAFSEEFVGGGGNDTFIIGFGGTDVAVGAGGDDLFYVAAGEAMNWQRAVQIVGGGGNDLLQIQGKTSDSLISLQSDGFSSSGTGINATGIATVEFLSGFDSSRGWALNAPLRYFLTLKDGFAPTGAPLVLDTTALAAGESFFIQNMSIQDNDAFIKLIGGAGADYVRAGPGGSYLEGGGGDDQFFAHRGNDSFFGGAGSDSFDVDVGIGGSGTDHIDGGEGGDLLRLVGGVNTNWTSVTLKGGEGADLQIVDVKGFSPTGVANIDLGAANDRIELRAAYGAFNVTLGAGSDVVEISTSNSGGISLVSGQGRNVTITDFDSGPGGDTLSWTTALNAYLAFSGSYSAGQNPFATGHVRLFQDGGDVLLQVRWSTNETFVTLLRLQNHLVADFNAGIGGFVPVAPPPPGGTSGDDVLVGTSGRDELDGKAGNDSIDGGGGADRMTGGLGNDIFFVDDAGDEVIEAPAEGNDEIRTGLASYSLAALPHVEKLTGTAGTGQALTGDAFANELRGGAGDDVLTGLGGNDHLDGGAGADTLRGGADHDIYIVDHAGDVVEEDATGGFDQIRTSLANYSLVGSHVENLAAATGGNHELRGSAGSNVLTGNVGTDFLLLHDGGSDYAIGGDGNDVIYFGAALDSADIVDGGAGRDALVLQGNVTMRLSNAHLSGIESLSLQSGANTRYGDTANNFYDFNITADEANVVAGQQLIVNASSLRAGEDFTFDGSTESDGRFLIYGGHGVDDLTGGDGVDVFFFEGSRWGADDRVDGGGGRDSMVISAGSGLTHIEFAADSFTNIESISLNNRYATDPTQKPSYELVLHNGNVAAGGTLIVNGSSVPLGQVVNIDGRGVHDGNLILFGGGGHDVMFGGDGADLIIGAGGADSLNGGAGADTFRYDSASDSVAGREDLIGDFQGGLDRIDLSRVDADSTAAGDQAFTWIGSNAFSGAAGELRTYESGGYRWIAGDTDGDGDGDLVIAFQIGIPPLVQGDLNL
jgi:Ca2+-binding RTX toxin-like protein